MRAIESGAAAVMLNSADVANAGTREREVTPKSPKGEGEDMSPPESSGASSADSQNRGARSNLGSAG
eukprot:9865772-Alexandrium_andersonii.AAC.1